MAQLQEEHRARQDAGGARFRLLAGVPWAIGIALVCWPLVIFVELLFAQHRESPSPLPQPGSWWVRGAVVVVAIGVGLWRGRVACRTREPSRLELTVRSVVAVAVVSAVLLGHAAYGESRERDFLEVADPSDAERAVTLEAGHAACDWLAARPWGPPRNRQSHDGAGRADMPPGANPTNSTMKLYDLYRQHVDDQAPGALTDAELHRVSLTMTAWYRLCPFQQFVHRPVSGAGGGGD